MTRTRVLFIATLFLSKLAVAGEVSKVEEKNYQLAADASVTVIGDEGTITIRGWEKNEVQLKMTKIVWHPSRSRAEELLAQLEVDISHTEQRLYIRQPNPHQSANLRFSDYFGSERWNNGVSVQVDFELAIPIGARLSIESDEGDVEVSGISGDLRVRIDEGNAFLQDLKSPSLEIGVDEGDVVLKNMSSPNTGAFIRLDEGALRVHDSQFSSLNVESDEGDIVVKNSTLKDGVFQTDEGEIFVDVAIQADGHCKLVTDEGNIRLVLPESTDAEFILETGHGRVSSDFPLSVRENSDDGEHASGVAGKGLASFKAYTEQGDIIIQKR
jgi:hypothetical protein